MLTSYDKDHILHTNILCLQNSFYGHIVIAKVYLTNSDLTILETRC